MAELLATLTCPHCGTRTPERMPANACVYFWPCPVCRTMVRPKAGDCCVFCSYGTEPCPPKRAH